MVPRRANFVTRGARALRIQVDALRNEGIYTTNLEGIFSLASFVLVGPSATVASGLTACAHTYRRADTRRVGVCAERNRVVVAISVHRLGENGHLTKFHFTRIFLVDSPTPSVPSD